MILFIALAIMLIACSGNVEVHGVPKEIALDVPFCVPDKDAGVADAADADVDASDGAIE